MRATMLKHTRKLITQTIDDFNILRTFFSYAIQVVYIIYLVYLLLIPNAIWYIHLSLLLVSVSFFIYDIISNNNIRRIKNDKPAFGILQKGANTKEFSLMLKSQKGKLKE